MYLLPCNMCVWANLDECFYIGNGTVRMKLFSVFFCASTMRSHYKVSRISKFWAYDAVLWCMCICCWWCSWQISTIILDERNRGEDCVAYIFDCVDHVILWPLDQIAKGNETKRNGQQNHRHLLQNKTASATTIRIQMHTVTHANEMQRHLHYYDYYLSIYIYFCEKQASVDDVNIMWQFSEFSFLLAWERVSVSRALQDVNERKQK